uniref:Uncharacterized protein n=1 Tax=Cereibacter sphaeroides (strain ATCC 17025 / ATH 2.4.3) TaxID=349102 RepID=A4WS14_CERS5
MGYRVAQLAHGFAVKNAEAERVSPVFPDKEGALDWLLTAAERRAPRERPCLACHRPFKSQGIHDRLCPHCGLAASVADMTPHSRTAAPPRRPRD